MMPQLIYVSGPYTFGDRTDNIRKAMLVGKMIMDKGHYPYIPHLAFYFDLMFPQKWDYWMELDLAFLSRCDAIIRIPGESRGADREIMFAHSRHIQIYSTIEEIPNAG